MAACISFSDSLSRADVASSNINIDDFFNKALAIATLCFSPPERVVPLAPIMVLKPSGKFTINS